MLEVIRNILVPTSFSFKFASK